MYCIYILFFLIKRALTVLNSFQINIVLAYKENVQRAILQNKLATLNER